MLNLLNSLDSSKILATLGFPPTLDSSINFAVALSPEIHRHITYTETPAACTSLAVIASWAGLLRSMVVRACSIALLHAHLSVGSEPSRVCQSSDCRACQRWLQGWQSSTLRRSVTDTVAACQPGTALTRLHPPSPSCTVRWRGSPCWHLRGGEVLPGA